MNPRALRRQRVIVLVGFVAVGVGGLPFVLLASISPADEQFYWIVTALGYGVLGWASWAWLTALSDRRDGASGMRRVLRLFAAACVLLGVAYLGFVHEVFQISRQFHHVGLKAQTASYVLSIAGLCLAASGFWSASNVVERGSPAALEETVEAASPPRY